MGKGQALRCGANAPQHQPRISHCISHQNLSPTISRALREVAAGCGRDTEHGTLPQLYVPVIFPQGSTAGLGTVNNERQFLQQQHTSTGIRKGGWCRRGLRE